MGIRVLIAIIAFVAGGGVGFLTSKALLDKKYAERAEDEIEEMRLYFMDKQTRGEKLADVSTHSKKINTSNGVIALSDVSNKNAEAKRNYNFPLAREPEAKTEEGVVADENDEEFIRLEEIGVLEPYVITLDEYAEGCPHFDKAVLYYYRDDNTLTNEGEEILAHVGDLIGYDAIEMVLEEEEVFVRNERMGTDYEVVLKKTSFQEEVIGVRPNSSPREAQEQRMKKRGKV